MTISSQVLKNAIIQTAKSTFPNHSNLSEQWVIKY